MGASLGIDFGTSATKAAVVADGKIRLVMDDARAHIASTVIVPAMGDLRVASGDAATWDPARTITSVKRLLGRAYDDPRVRELDAGVGYHIRRAADGSALIDVDGVAVAPVQVVAAVLAHVRDLAERGLGQRIDNAVLSMPVATCRGYAAALARAASLAGLREVRLVYEPVAALWGSRIQSGPGARRVLVADFGAGTYDCALLELRADRVDVVASGGDEYLGGDDFDLSLADGVAGDVFRSQRVDLHRDQVRWTEIVRACEAAKRRLSDALTTELALPGAYVKDRRYHDLAVRLHRSEVEPGWRPLVARAVAATGEVLARSRSPVSLIDDLVLVGGTNLTPLVRRTLVKKVGRQPTAVTASDVVIAAGLAMMAAHAAASPASRVAG